MPAPTVISKVSLKIFDMRAAHEAGAVNNFPDYQINFITYFSMLRSKVCKRNFHLAKEFGTVPEFLLPYL